MNETLDFDISPHLEIIYEHITFETGIKFMIVYFFVMWIALLIWVIKDIHNRTQSILLQILSILIILVGTPFGIFIYLLIRPSSTLFERYHNEVEENLNTMEYMIQEKNKDFGEALHCFICESPIGPDFHYCPSCKIELKHECNDCEKVIYRNWEICPYCGEDQEKIELPKKPLVLRTKVTNEVQEDVLEIINDQKKTEEIEKSA